jgi:hypothetical protein
MTTTTVTLTIEHPTPSAELFIDTAIRPYISDINQDIEQGWNISLVVGETTTTQELITQLWKILYKEDDSDLVVTMICELLNETEATLNNKEKETTQ